MLETGIKYVGLTLIFSAFYRRIYCVAPDLLFCWNFSHRMGRMTLRHCELLFCAVSGFLSCWKTLNTGHNCRWWKTESGLASHAAGGFSLEWRTFHSLGISFSHHCSHCEFHFGGVALSPPFWNFFHKQGKGNAHFLSQEMGKYLVHDVPLCCVAGGVW